MLANEDRSPTNADWQARRPNAGTAVAHAQQGGLIGLVPASVGLFVIDVDPDSSPAVHDRLHDALDAPLTNVVTPTTGRHLYFHSGETVAHEAVRLKNATLHQAGTYVVLWSPAAAALALTRYSNRGRLSPYALLPQGTKDRENDNDETEGSVRVNVEQHCAQVVVVHARKTGWQRVIATSTDGNRKAIVRLQQYEPTKRPPPDGLWRRRPALCEPTYIDATATRCGWHRITALEGQSPEHAAMSVAWHSRTLDRPAGAARDGRTAIIWLEGKPNNGDPLGNLQLAREMARTFLLGHTYNSTISQKAGNGKEHDEARWTGLLGLAMDEEHNLGRLTWTPWELDEDPYAVEQLRKVCDKAKRILDTR